MKLRNGFVSNSSSCSFFIRYYKGITLEAIKKLFTLEKETPSYAKEFLYEKIHSCIKDAKPKGSSEFGFDDVNTVDEDFLKTLKYIEDRGLLTEEALNRIKDSFSLDAEYVWFMEWDSDIFEDENLTDREKAILWLRDHAETVSTSEYMFGYSVG